MGESLKKRISFNLRSCLEQKEKTQADLARALGASTGTVSDWCNGNRLPRIDTMEEICAWLGISLRDLIPDAESSYMSVSGMMVTDPDEQEVVIGYRNADDLGKAMVKRTLGIDKKGHVGSVKGSSVS